MHLVGNLLYDQLFAPHSANPTVFLSQPDGRDITYAGFVARAAQIAHVLTANGVEPGDRILVQAPKCVEMVALYAATLQVGAIFLPLNTAYTKDEVSYFAGDATPKLLVGSDSAAEALSEIAHEVGATLLMLNSDGSGSLMASVDAQHETFPTAARGADDLAALLYTSGTTGRSKGAMMSHDNLLSNSVSLVDEWRITDADRLLHALPIFHTHGLFVALNTALLSGATVVFLKNFDLDMLFAELADATMLMGVPTFYTRLLADHRLSPDIVSTMRLFISGSAPLLAETHIAFTERTGHRILERYGMTETNMITSNPYDGDRRAGTVGAPLPGVEVKVVDPDTGANLDPGQVGMIEVRGRNVFSGYWQMPEKTAAELRENGFFITGDLGSFSDDGYLSIVGRAKDLIITGGYNVYPKEIEDVLNTVDGVLESAVFGVPDPDFGETIIAAIVPETTAGVSEDTLRTAVENGLAQFKQPRVFKMLEALPRNAMGKVEKKKLRDTHS